MAFWAALGQQAAGQAASGIVNGAIQQIFKHWNDKKQIKQQRDLNVLNKEMMDYGQKLGLEQWEATGPVGQMKQLEKAGLNKGLMYGMGGAGGATTGSTQSGGSQAAQTGPIGEGAGMGILTGAQLRLMNAQARNLEVEADNKEGVDRENTMADTGLKQAQTNVQTGMQKLQEFQNKVNEGTLDEQIGKIVQEYANMQEQFKILESQGDIARGTKTTEIERIRKEKEITDARATHAILVNVLAKSQDLAIRQSVTESRARVANLGAQTEYTHGLTGKLASEVEYITNQVLEIKQRISASKSDIEIRKLKQQLEQDIFEWSKDMKISDNIREDIKFGINKIIEVGTLGKGGK